MPLIITQSNDETPKNDPTRKTARMPWVVVRRLLPTATLLLFGNLCMGLLVVALLDTNPWALPAVGLPMALLLRATSTTPRPGRCGSG
jgi:hypothetical protein